MASQDLNITQVIGYLNTFLNDIMKSQITVSEKKKTVALIRKVYQWVREVAPEINGKENHVEELITRLVVSGYKPDIGGTDKQPPITTKDDIFGNVRGIRNNLLSIGMNRSKYTNEKLKIATNEAKKNLLDLEKEAIGLENSMEEMKNKLNGELTPEVKFLQEQRTKQVIDLERWKNTARLAKQINEEKGRKLGNLKKEFKKAKKENELKSKHYFEEECERRAIQNKLEDAFGPIRAFCRIRQTLKKGNQKSYFEVLNDQELLVKDKKGFGEDKTKFHFDRVFRPNSSQAEVFMEVSALLESVLDGYNVCCLAYGQTGSGKTYTMTGGQGEERGIIPRAVEMLFQEIEELQKHGWDFNSQVAAMEVYNNTVRDLLQNNMENGKTENVIPKSVNVNKPKDVLKLLDEASARRINLATHYNSEASRAHLIFQLIFNIKTNKEPFSSCLTFIDLAGSELIYQNGKTQTEKEECDAVKTSFAALTEVLSAVAEKSEAIPFEKSVLTQLLEKPMHQSKAKTVIFSNINPNREFLDSDILFGFRNKIITNQLAEPKKLNSEGVIASY